MEEAELEQVISDYLTTLYNCTYNGLLEVTKQSLDEGWLYTLSLGIPSYMCKTTISGEFQSDIEFIDYIKEEIRTRNYVKVYFYKVNRTEELYEA